MKRPRHIPDASRPGYTYCGRFYVAGDIAKGMSLRLALIDLRTDDIESAECKACQRSDDRRVRETYWREEAERNSREAALNREKVKRQAAWALRTTIDKGG